MGLAKRKSKDGPVLTGIIDLETLTPRRIGVRVYKMYQDKRLNLAINANGCITDCVSTALKDVIGVVQWTTNSQIGPEKQEIAKATFKVQKWEPILSLSEVALPRIQPRESTEVDKGHRQVAGCLA